MATDSKYDVSPKLSKKKGEAVKGPVQGTWFEGGTDQYGHKKPDEFVKKETEPKYGDQYDPEVEKEAIAAEESYKKTHGKYRESSAYNKAKKAVRKDLSGNVIGDYKM